MIGPMIEASFNFMSGIITTAAMLLPMNQLTMFHIPVKHRIVLMGSTQQVEKFLVHPKLVKPLTQIFLELEQRQLLGEIKSFWGCYNPRKISGDSRWSYHASAQACDFNADLLPPGTAAKGFTSEFVNVWKRHGFIWGGDWQGTSRDPMHFEWRGGA